MKESVHTVSVFKTRFEVSLIKKRLLYLLFHVVPAMPEKVLDSLELKFQTAVRCWEFYQAIFPAPYCNFNFFKPYF